MKLIVGLGNPGKLYEKTRHNIGFAVLDELARHFNIEFKKVKYGGKYLCTVIDSEKVILLKPQKYINITGEVLVKYVNYFNIDVADILIIHDDLDLETGHFKLKTKGSSAGHKGLKNIEQNLGTQEYNRLKIGISNNKNIETKNYVLGRFGKSEKEIIDSVIVIAKNIALDFISSDIEVIMNNYNSKKKTASKD